MTTDFAKMITHVEKAKAELENAMATFAATDRVTLGTSYIMGHLRASLAVCDSAAAFIRDVQAKDSKDEPVKT
jgi:hypothetical protein